MEKGNRYFGCRYCGHIQKNLTTADMRCPVCQHMMEDVYLTEKPSRKDRPHVIRTPRYKSGFARSVVTQLAPLLLLLIALFLTMPVMGKAYAECVTSNYDSTTGQLFTVITAYNKTTKILHNVQIEVSVNDSATGTLLATQSVEVGTLWWGAKKSIRFQFQFRVCRVGEYIYNAAFPATIGIYCQEEQFHRIPQQETLKTNSLTFLTSLRSSTKRKAAFRRPQWLR